MTNESNAIHSWLDMATRMGASDLHLVTGYAPYVRAHGNLAELDPTPLESEYLKELMREICDKAQWNDFSFNKNLDFAMYHDVTSNAESNFESKTHRCRVNFFMNQDRYGACFRLIPSTIPSFEWTGFPVGLAERLASQRNGLVLLTGMTGAGKTTSLAMIVNLLNQRGNIRIITVEDPIEYIYPRRKNSIVSQREVGGDVSSFAEGLRYGLRQDPDVILVGEIRDRETAQMALSAAETGHLVFSTLHTRDAKGAISRFADLFPQNSQPEVRSQLAMSLRAIVSQHLLPAAFEDKRQLVLEILFNNNPIAAGIRQGKLESIDTGITTGRQEGMVSLDESLRQHVSEGNITRETALQFCTDRNAF
ncbi:MAG: PilT/PilU family type 4a pilus ATPase [Planctomycetota bacterium]